MHALIPRTDDDRATNASSPRLHIVDQPPAGRDLFPVVTNRTRLITEHERAAACQAMERLLDAGVSYQDARAATCGQAALVLRPRRSTRGRAA